MGDTLSDSLRDSSQRISRRRAGCVAGFLTAVAVVIAAAQDDIPGWAPSVFTAAALAVSAVILSWPWALVMLAGHEARERLRKIRGRR